MEQKPQIELAVAVVSRLLGSLPRPKSLGLNKSSEVRGPDFFLRRDFSPDIR